MSSHHTDFKKQRQAAGRLERQLERNWFLLAGMTVVSTLGLVMTVAPMLKAQLASVWPWANTHVVLLTGLVVSMGILVWHLFTQRRKIFEVREHMDRMAREARALERKQDARLHALMNVSRMMGAVSDPHSVFEGITSTCLEIFDCQQATLMTFDPEKYELEIRASTGHLKTNRVMTPRRPVGDGIAGWVAQHQQALILQADTDMSQYPELTLDSDHVAAAMVTPILVREELVGVLCISSGFEDVRYAEDDLRALEIFADNAGTCIRYSERAEWMRQMIEKQMNANQPSGPVRVTS